MDAEAGAAGPQLRTRPVPERKAALLALVVPAVLALLGTAGVALQFGPLLPFVFLGFPLIFLGSEDALATGHLLWIPVWAVIAATLWWFAGRWAARAAGTSPAGFTWSGWGRALGVAAMVILTCQIVLAMVLAMAL